MPHVDVESFSILEDEEEESRGAMAGMVDRIRRRNRLQQPQRDWTSTGSFLNKPARGWLHPDEQLAPDAGVCYGVRYIGCMEVKQSMKTLDFDTRTAVAKEAISRVCESAGLKNATKRQKKSAKINKLLGENTNLVFAGSNVNLTITTEMLNLSIMETGEVIVSHQMPGISFASGGDPDTMDFVAYVAKDDINGRACYVLECGGGLAQDVITTIGQAFEIRFKQYLANQPQAVSVPNSRINNGDRWGNEEDYYNDRPGAQPPSPVPGELPPEYAAPKCNLPVSDGLYTSMKNIPEPKLGLLIDFSEDARAYDNNQIPVRSNASGPIYDNTEQKGAMGGTGVVYDNPNTDDDVYDNREPENVAGAMASARQPDLDAFDMKPFTSALTTNGSHIDMKEDKSDGGPYHEEWFHGPLTREQTEELLKKDGDFLVRESTKSPGQFVLSGMHDGRIRHLLLVDPEGVVRTRDRTFTSVGHLINYHMENNLPIVSQESELILRRPIIHSGC